MAIKSKFQGKPLEASATATTIVLNWTASTLPAGAPPVTGYYIYRATTAGGEQIGGATLARVSVVVTYTDTTPVPGTTYFYMVTAVNQCQGAGSPPCESLPSNEVSAIVPVVLPAPNPPTNLTGIAQ